MKQRSRILFFIAGSVPTEAEEAAARALGTTKFRNASQVSPADAVEKCDGVAGRVPAIYAARFPVLDKPAEVPAVAAPEPLPPAVEASTLVATAPAAPVAPSEPQAPTAPVDPAAETRANEDAWARTAKVGELRSVLSQLGIAFNPTHKKADLLAMFLARPAVQAAPEPAAPVA